MPDLLNSLPETASGNQPDDLASAASGLIYIEHLGQETVSFPVPKPNSDLQDFPVSHNCAKILAFNERGQVVSVQCGLWSCPHCAKLNARLWAWRVKLHIEAHPDQTPYFWTLTLGSKYTQPWQGYEALPGLWDTFRQRIQKKLPEKWSYCAFVEGQPQRSNMPHFHIVSMSACPYRLKDVAAQVGFGYMADEQKITSLRAAAYVAKYASKQGQEMPRSFRRVRASQDWAKLPEFDGTPLMVKSRKEHMYEFILRVHEITGVSTSDLYERWDTAMEVFEENKAERALKYQSHAQTLDSTETS